MADEIDTSRAPRGLMAASHLVETVSRTGDLAERHYLEIKGPLDLSSRADAAKIAKFILGAANRPVERASTAFEGCAAMVIGVSGAGSIGIPAVEILEIDKKIKPFLGEPGPLWDAIWVPLPDSPNSVLVIVVDPPKVGNGPFICRKNGDGVQDGRVYVRGDGETREATADELDALITRGSAAQAPEIDFEVQLLGEVNCVPGNDADWLEDYIAQTRARLLNALPSHNPDVVTSAMLRGLPFNLASSVTNFMETPEHRTEDEYLEEIESWEQRLRAAWPAAMIRLLERILPSPIIRITNRTSTFIHDVELKIHLEGDVSGAEYNYHDPHLKRSDLELPASPRRWGPRERLPHDLIPPYLDTQSYTSPVYPSSPPRVRWENSGSVTITLEAGDLRPLASEEFDEQELVLYTRNPELTHLSGTWSITARGFNQVFGGELSVVVGEAVDTVGSLDAIFNPNR